MADFFGKLKDGIGMGINTASTRSKEALDTLKLKGQLSTLQAQKKDALEELGNVVFMLYQRGASDEVRIRGKCDSVAEIAKQISTKEDEIRTVHAIAEENLGRPRPVSVCACGADIAQGVKFCVSCGKKVNAD